MEIERNELNTGALDTNKRSNIVRILTANDVAYWGADAFISVALALFVTTFIEGATVLNVGIALMINRVVGAIAAVPIGRWFDKHKGYMDEVWGLALACLLAGLTYILLSFSTEIWQLYTAMFFLGIISVIDVSSWRILFYSHVDHGRLGQTIGVYQMLYSLGIGLFLAIGGFTGERFGYDKVLFFGGLIVACGSLLPVLIRGHFLKAKR